jgi:hypothetical protein
MHGHLGLPRQVCPGLRGAWTETSSWNRQRGRRQPGLLSASCSNHSFLWSPPLWTLTAPHGLSHVARYLPSGLMEVVALADSGLEPLLTQLPSMLWVMGAASEVSSR